MDQQEQLKKEAVEFIMALCNPKLSLRDVAWEGTQAAIALYNISGDFNATNTGIQRLKQLVASK